MPYKVTITTPDGQVEQYDMMAESLRLLLRHRRPDVQVEATDERGARVALEAGKIVPVEATLTLQLDRGLLKRLQHLVDACRADDVPGMFVQNVPELVAAVLRHLDDAVLRSGSWERDAFCQLFPHSVLDDAAAAIFDAGDEPPRWTGSGAP